MKLLSYGFLLIASFALCADSYVTYNATKAASYATTNYNKAYGSANPFYDFSGAESGGNCTNFVSQCIIAGFIGSTSPNTVFSRRFDFDIDKNSTSIYRWFYQDISNRGESWSGANKMYEYANYNRSTYRGLHFKYITHDTPSQFMDYRKVIVGDVIFADWEGDGIIDHTMIVTRTNRLYSGYNEIRVTYQSINVTDRGLGDINEQYNLEALFYVYRPVDYNPSGL